MAFHAISCLLKQPLKHSAIFAFATPSILRSTKPSHTAPPHRRPFCTAAPRHPRILIEYCPGCRWGLRAGWIAQELLVTFEKELGEVAIRPSQTAGVFDVWVGNIRIWCRADMGRFPDLREVKRAVRDIVEPDKTLGHTDH